jgi:hypothetical protein
MRSSPEGREFYTRFMERLDTKIPYRKAYWTLYNCLRDIYVNHKTLEHVGISRNDMTTLYTQHAFPNTSFLNHPKHLQFVYTLLREAMVPAEICQVDPDVRRQVDFFLQHAHIQKATGTLQPLQERLTYIMDFVEPIFIRFLQSDIAEHTAEHDEKNTKGGEPDGGENSTNSNTEP